MSIEIYELFIDPLFPPKEMELLYQTVLKHLLSQPTIHFFFTSLPYRRVLRPAGHIPQYGQTAVRKIPRRSVKERRTRPPG